MIQRNYFLGVKLLWFRTSKRIEVSTIIKNIQKLRWSFIFLRLTYFRNFKAQRLKILNLALFLTMDSKIIAIIYGPFPTSCGIWIIDLKINSFRIG